MARLTTLKKWLAVEAGVFLALAVGASASHVHAQSPASASSGSGNSSGGAVVFRCPGTPPLFTNSMTDAEVKEKGCKPVDSTPITVSRGAQPKVVNTAAVGSTARIPPASSAAPGARPTDVKIDPAEQKARDTDSKRILAAELRKEEERLAAMQKEFNSGEPERRGDERNFQKYADRVADMKSSIARKESDIVSIKREIAKLPL